jgi:hypothetical protein
MGDWEPIPYRIWIGVTGHRDAAADPRIVDQVGAILARLRRQAAEAGFPDPRFGVISALAEGPDQYLTRAILREPDTLLVAVLPMPAATYRKSLADEASRAEFDALLGLACDIRAFDPPDRRGGDVTGGVGGRVEVRLREDDAYVGADGYSAAGTAIIEHCDVLLAVLDPNRAVKRGGTAAVVGEARRHRHAPVVYCIDPHTFDLDADPRAIDEQALRRIRHLNRALSKPVRRRWSDELRGVARRPDVGLDPQVLDPLLAWLEPLFSRADARAVRLRRRERAARLVLFMGAAAAVGVAAGGLAFSPDNGWLSIVEATILLIVPASVFYARRSHLHSNWLAYRALAENVRSMFFVNLVATHGTTGARHSRGGPARFLTENRWVSHICTELVVRFPAGPPVRGDTSALRAFLSAAWLGPQVDYYTAKESQSRSTESVFTQTITALFTATVLAVSSHYFGLPGLHHRADKVLALVAIVIPALGGALSGLRDSDELQRHADRSRHMVQRLTALQSQLDEATTITSLRRVSVKVWQQLTAENAEWFDLMLFRELELHV